MNILVIGQCTLHWGRMEFGNIGNYYIIEPFFRQLHKSFPNATIHTTFQMSNEFCERENIEVKPMELYYGWDNDRQIAEKELEIAQKYESLKILYETTDYIELVRRMDLVIDFSGDIWGDNADFLGDDRFFVGLVKNRVAQIFANKTAMIAGSPGPFTHGKNLQLARKVYKNFDLVTNREPISVEILKDQNFDVSKTVSLACPAFLFEPASNSSLKPLNKINKILSKERESIGFLICGWSFTTGPYDKITRSLEEYMVFVEAIEKFLGVVDADIYLMSHSNGFPIPPDEFRLIHGRDFPIMKKLHNILKQRGNVKNVYLLEEVYDAWTTKAILGNFDMVVSGRVHAAVGAMSQTVPTVIIDYGHEPKAHKLKGFAMVTNQINYLAYPEVENDIFLKMIEVWQNKIDIKSDLNKRIPEVKNLAISNFKLLESLLSKQIQSH